MIFSLLAIFGLSLFIREMDGPFGVMNWLRNRLTNNKYVGVFFYHLLSCWFCTGCHAGWIVYLLANPSNSWNVQNFILWVFAGGAICYITNLFTEKYLM